MEDKDNKELLRLAEIGKATEKLFNETNSIEFGDRYNQEEGFLCYAINVEELLKWYNTGINKYNT